MQGTDLTSTNPTLKKPRQKGSYAFIANPSYAVSVVLTLVRVTYQCKIFSLKEVGDSSEFKSVSYSPRDQGLILSTHMAALAKDPNCCSHYSGAVWFHPSPGELASGGSLGQEGRSASVTYIYTRANKLSKNQCSTHSRHTAQSKISYQNGLHENKKP